jgi:hypothetical protein
MARIFTDVKTIDEVVAMLASATRLEVSSEHVKNRCQERMALP